ncbi:bifunctional folylpolyglutamate synthase/dihydrofolate synthase [Fodinicurvata sediminis]|uniref:bifunctional folylpolyglutamate synthase/dihydrofolate synthase n=1 Tax=Fodinicurvata sediminis TaxID=1121832 RepID=UPI0003B491F2|nr:folylpolyglutamate synthase/dihydrofolate synthase family protein [Fodinicurvata sediminis]
MSQNSDAVLARLNRLHPKIIDLSLGRVESLLAAIGHPERQLPPVVHVAGTNGKGSVLAMLRGMLEESGRAVHVYTSPHLARFHERIRLAGELISEPELLALLEECEAANGEAPITFFEVTTAAAFLAFARRPADILLLEVGLGGRLDATNVIARPELTLITPISMDHMQYLGDSLEKIAREKAGILKSGVPAIIGLQPPEALQAIQEKAQEVGAPLIIQGRDFEVERQGNEILFRQSSGETRWPLPGLLGPHQVQNAGLALAAAQKLDSFLPDPAFVGQGLRKANWPARLQHLSAGTLPDTLPQGWELWLDGGHNAAAGQALACALKDWPESAETKPLDLVYGMLNSKTAAAFLDPLSPLVRQLRAVEIPGEPNSLSANEAAHHARACGFQAAPAASLSQALQDLVHCSAQPGRILICGSLYLAGEVLRQNEGERV